MGTDFPLHRRASRTLLTALLYAVVMLDVRIAGLDTSVGKAEAAKEDVEKIAKIVAEIGVTALEGTGFGGTGGEHGSKMLELTRELEQIAGEKEKVLSQKVEKELQEVREIEKRGQFNDPNN